MSLVEKQSAGTVSAAKKMRIAFVSEGNPENRRTWSGTPYGVYSAIRKLGYDVEWISLRSFSGRVVLGAAKCLDGFASRILRRGIVVRRWPFVVKFLARRFIIEDRRYDLVVSVGLTSCAFYQTKLPVVPVIDATFDCFNGYYGKPAFPIFAKLADFSEQVAANRAAKIIAASQWCKESLIKHYHIPEERVCLFQLGANISSVRNNVVCFPKKNEELRLLFIGFDTRRKGLKTALTTVEKLRCFYKRRVRIDVIGCSGDTTSEKTPFVRFHGKLNKNVQTEMELFEKIVASAHVFILPTRAECAGMVFSEAAAYGLPVFSYDTGGVGSYVENGGNGMLLPPGANADDFSKAIVECWDTGKFPLFSERGKLMFKEKLSWECWPNRLKNLFESVVDVEK